MPQKENQSSIIIIAFLTPVFFWFAPVFGFIAAFVCSIICMLIANEKIKLPERLRIPANYVSSYASVILIMSIVSFAFHGGFKGDPMDSTSLNSQSQIENTEVLKKTVKK